MALAHSMTLHYRYPSHSVVFIILKQFPRWQYVIPGVSLGELWWIIGTNSKYMYLTPHHLAPKGLIDQLVQQSHQSCGGRRFNSHLTTEFICSWVNFKTSFVYKCHRFEQFSCNLLTKHTQSPDILPYTLLSISLFPTLTHSLPSPTHSRTTHSDAKRLHQISSCNSN